MSEVQSPPALPPGAPPGAIAPSAADLRAMRRTLTAASDQQVRQVVALVDEMTQRGVADALIEPLRRRLVQLRPPRRLRFERLLFMPLDPLMVQARDWQPFSPTIPRTAIMPLAGIVRIALGRDVARIDALIAGRTANDVAVVEEAGALLWPQAGRILAIAPLPMEWPDSGLNTTVYRPIATGVAAVLVRRAAIESLVQDASSGVLGDGEDAITALLADLAGEAPETQALVVALLVVRLPHSGALLRALAGTTVTGAFRRTADHATDSLVDMLERPAGVESRVARMGLDAAAVEIRRIGAFLSELEERGGDQKRRNRLRALRQRLDASCRTRFAEALKEDLLTPIQAMAGSIDRPVQTLMETTARHLRELETEARQIGGAETYDAQLRQTVATVKAMASAGGLSVMRSARLVEILAGPEAAMSLLEPGP